MADSQTRYDIGTRFGRLTLIGKIRVNKKTKWVVKCDCGTQKEVDGHSVTSGKTTSCGCHRVETCGDRFRTHGQHGTPTYNIWKGMRDRINRKKHKDYIHYGGRGIRYCERWEDYTAFLADLGECPPGYSLERVDVNGDYCPENCCWIPFNEQMKNTRRSLVNRKE